MSQTLTRPKFWEKDQCDQICLTVFPKFEFYADIHDKERKKTIGPEETIWPTEQRG